MKIDMSSVGKRIRTIREKRHLTLEQFAKIIGRDKQTVWRWEKAERGVSLKTVNLVAEKLDCSPSYILGYHEDMHAGFDAPSTEIEGSRPCTFGQKVRTHRKKIDLSIEQFAQKLAVPESRITELENMIDHPADNELNRIALVLGLAPECLARNSNAWHEGVPPQMAVLELAKKMLEIDPYLNIYLEDMRSTDAEAAFLAAAIRLGFERFRM